MTDATRRRRVPAMAPDERRAALVEATLPLVKEFGADVSTRQIADAAGVAEGTIFGVFPDKVSLIRAAVVRAMDPAAAIKAIGEIDRSLDLRRRLELATGILIERTAENFDLMSRLMRSDVFRHRGDPAHGDRVGPPITGGPEGGHGPPPEIIEARERVVDAVVALIGPDGPLLRRSPGFAVKLLVSIVFVAGRGGFGFMPAMAEPEEIVSLLLDGLLREPDRLRTQALNHNGGTSC